MKYHPDKSNSSNKEINEEKFKSISHAYDILKTLKRKVPMINLEKKV